jgi:hypothetical protein
MTPKWFKVLASYSDDPPFFYSSVTTDENLWFPITVLT